MRMALRATPWPASSSAASVASGAAKASAAARPFVIEEAQHRLAPCRLQFGETHAIGREHARQRMDEHATHAERIGDEASVLAAGAAECVEHVSSDVVAALHRDGEDRVRHILDRDPDEAVGRLAAGVRPSPISAASAAKRACTISASSGWSWAGPKIFGKKSGRSFPTMTLASVTVSGPPRR